MRKIEKREDFEQEADVPIIDIIRHTETEYKENPKKVFPPPKETLDVNAPGFALDEDHLDLTERGIEQMRETAQQLDEMIDKKNEVLLLVSSPALRAHASALVLEKELRDRGVQFLNLPQDVRVIETMAHHDAIAGRGVARVKDADISQAINKRRRAMETDSFEMQDLNFHRFVRHMANIYQWLKPETKEQLKGKRLRVVCISHDEATMEFRGDVFAPDDPNHPFAVKMGHGQILEVKPHAQLKPGQETPASVRIVEKGAHQERIEYVKLGFEPPKPVRQE